MDKIEETKRYLKRYKKNKALITRLECKLKTLDERITSVRSPQITDLPRGGQPVRLEDLISDKEELEQRIERLKVKGRKYRSDIYDMIDELEDVRHVEILEAFLVDGFTIDEIADKEGYTPRHVYRMYKDAITILSSKCH